MSQMKSSVLVGTLAALAVSAAFANEPPNTTTSGDQSVTFEALDTNHDGRISEAEARANAELSSGYRSSVGDASKGMTQEEFDAWNSSRHPSQTPPSQ